jgi:hypothetical protein
MITRWSILLSVLTLIPAPLLAQEWCDEEKQTYTILFLNAAREYVDSEANAQQQNALATQDQLLNERFQVQKDGSILDRLTGLTWSRFSVRRTYSGDMIDLNGIHATAKEEGNNPNLVAQSVTTPWRLPTAFELKSIMVTREYANQYVQFNWQDSVDLTPKAGHIISRVLPLV